ncbi:MAG: His/Gly/Thr/Pro-type tRNA ligase C-terminal domain-containing protein [Actinomycetota bacterium]|nr:His/Gly/Thr/Pro-type tRNA ligase C-terminal domain-containing protein [Actinomycetota bacterium]
MVDTTGGSAALGLTHQLRGAGITTDRAFDARSMKAQFKAADRSGARLAVVIGERERAEATVTVRDLTSGDQETIGRHDVVAHVRKWLS